jgi:hypothetical protein
VLYAAIRDPDSVADERVTGALSTVGLLAGAWLGVRLTRGIPGERAARAPGRRPGSTRGDDAPVALIGRASDGTWAAGSVVVAPLSRALAPQRGLAVSLVGAAF